MKILKLLPVFLLLLSSIVFAINIEPASAALEGNPPKVVNNECLYLTCEDSNYTRQCAYKDSECTKLDCEYRKLDEAIRDQDTCFYEAATYYKKKEYCDQIKQDSTFDNCIEELRLEINCDEYQDRHNRNDCYYNKAIENNDPILCKNLTVLNRPDVVDQLNCYIQTKPTTGITFLRAIAVLWTLTLFAYIAFALYRLWRGRFSKTFLYSSLIFTVYLVLTLQIEDFRFGRFSIIKSINNLYEVTLHTLYGLPFPDPAKFYVWVSVLVILLPVVNFVTLILNKKNRFTSFVTVLNYIFIALLVFVSVIFLIAPIT